MSFKKYGKIRSWFLKEMMNTGCSKYVGNSKLTLYTLYVYITNTIYIVISNTEIKIDIIKHQCQSLSDVRPFVTLSNVVHPAPLTMEFSRQEYWGRLPLPSPGDLPNPGIKPGSPALQADSLPSEPPGKIKIDIMTHQTTRL